MISREACQEADQQMAALSERERECVVLAGKGLTDREIAAAVHLSFWTVAQYLKAAFRKLGVKTRTEAAVIATKAGLV